MVPLIGRCYWSALAVERYLGWGDFTAQASEAAKPKVDLVADGIARGTACVKEATWGSRKPESSGTYSFYNNLLGLGLTVFYRPALSPGEGNALSDLTVLHKPGSAS